MNKKLGFGLMRLPMLDNGKVNFDEFNKMVDEYLERGFTYFDTALMYCDGQSEAAVKKGIVERHPRESFTITTKMHSGYFKTPEEMEKVFEGQLERTGAGYFDYYLVHDVNSHSYPHYTKCGTFEWLKDKKDKGLVKCMGFSFHDGPELLDQVLTEHPEAEFVQLQINYLDWNSVSVRSRECYEVAVKHGKKVIVMEPVKGGTLANVPAEVSKLFKDKDPNASIPSWAIRFAATPENVMLVLSGMSNLEQLRDNIGYMQDFKPLTDEEFAMALEAAKIINKEIAIPCTGCSYCTGGCPVGMPIPTFFSLYNTDKKDINAKNWTPQQELYFNVAKTSCKASDCIKCGMCEGICPQSLKIRDLLDEVANYFEVENA